MNAKLTATLSASALCLGAAAPAATAATTSTSSGPPVIHEAFSPLPCKGRPSQRTTLELEGCAEHRVLTVDRRIDSLAKQIYTKLRPPQRPTFVTAERRWLVYRDSYCTAVAAPSAGGTAQPVLFATCLTGQDSEHAEDLKRYLQDAFEA